MNKENSVFLKMKKIQENGVNKKVRNFIEFQSKLYNEKGELIRIKSSKKMSAQNKKDEERIISKRKRVLSSDFFSALSSHFFSAKWKNIWLGSSYQWQFLKN